MPSTVLDLDATNASSYTSGQAWNNLTASPADGEAQSAYNFNLGTTSGVNTDDPTFTGSAGSSSAYFALDGGDVFQIPANTTLISNLPKTTGGTDYWVAIAFQYKADAGSAHAIWATNPASATTAGVRLTLLTSNRVQFLQRGDTAAVTTSSSLLPVLVDGTDYVIIISLNGGNFRGWVNSATATSATISPNACTTNSAGLLTVGGTTTPSLQLINGSRIYAFAMGNAFIGDTEAAAIIEEYNRRHGRTYA